MRWVVEILLLLAVAQESLGDDNVDFFINSVHSLSSNVTKSLIIEDNKVVWSPLAVGNVIAARNNDTILQNGFKAAFTYLDSELNTTLISSYFGPLNYSQFATSNATNGSEFGKEFGLKMNPNSNATDIFVAGLGVEGLWETPFHPRYAKKSKFFLNSTHVMKTKFMNNIGIYKFAEFNGSKAVAMPVKNTHKTYVILIKPDNPDELEQVNSYFEGVNFTEIWKKFKTKRVQLSLPKIDIDSQFSFNLDTTTTVYQKSSLKLSYTGIYNNLNQTQQRPTYRPIKFTRLRRRKDDVKFLVNSPFLFYVFDSHLSGFLLGGLVLNPVDELPLVNTEQKQFEFSLERMETDRDCLTEWNALRKNSSSDKENILVYCGGLTKNENYSRIISNNSVFNTVFNTSKKSEKEFYRNEVDKVNGSFFEIQGKVKYLTYSAFDMKAIKVPYGNYSLTILTPNERSGLHLIEEGLEMVSYQSFNCQMRDVALRLRLPEFSAGNFTVRGEVVKEEAEHEQVEIERKGGAGRRKRKYRKMNIDRSFMFVLAEERKTGGGIVAVGRVVAPEISLKYKFPK